MDKLERAVREQPLASVAAAGAAGAILGGIVLGSLGRLAFAAAVGYVANELWHREERLDITALLEKLSRKDEQAR